ncbi:sugar-binding protein [Methanococcoides methylutens]|uniref:sugar-binding protein n=1 Tax=Methanococcoides methylutens TaxID=2226 RepID=UPI0006943506|nr:sugar-binding protein [Methanococcoides methylutens]
MILSIGIATAEAGSFDIQISKTNEIVTVSNAYGTVIYSGTDDADAIEAAIKELNNGGIILFKKGVYDIDRTLLLKSNLSLIGEEGVVFDCFNGLAFTVSTGGYSSLTSTLSSNVASADTIIKLSSTTGLNVGDYIKISDDVLSVHQDQYYKNGEIIKIISIDGNTITIDRPLYDGYATANNAMIRKISMLENINIENIDFVGYGIETNSVGISLYATRNFHISDCEVSNFGTQAIRLWDCLDAVVEDNVFKNNFKTGMGYSVNLVNACDNIMIRNNSFLENGRHYIAAGAGTSGSASYGMVRNVDVINNIFRDATQEAVNTHATTRAVVTVIGNEITNCGKGLEFSNSDSIVRDNTITDCLFGVHTLGTGTHLFENNYFQRNTVAIDSGASSVIRGNTFDNGGYIRPRFDTVIDNNRFVNYSGLSIYLSSAGEKMVITNNIFEGSVSSLIKLVYCTDIYLANNDLNGYVELGKSDNVRIANNHISSSSYGIRVWDAEGTYTISSNELVSGSKGVSLENLDGSPTAKQILISHNAIDAPVEVYNGGYPNVVIEEGSITSPVGPITSPEDPITSPEGPITSNAPLSNAGIDQVITSGEIVTLDGSASTDDVGIASYVWDFDSSDGLQQDATGAVVQHSYSLAGVYTATLTVTDGDGEIDSDTVLVTVEELPLDTSNIKMDVVRGTATIDGDLTDWQYISGVTIQGDSGRSSEEDNTATVKAMYDDSYLYVVYDVTDTNLQSDGLAEMDGLHLDDSVEIYLDTLHNAGTSMQADDYQFIINLNGVVLDDVGTGGGKDYSYSSNILSSVNLQGTKNDAITDTGYIIEVAIPWSDVGGKPSIDVIGLFLAVNDQDNTDAVYLLNWCDLTTSYAVPDFWGNAIIAAASNTAPVMNSINDISVNEGSTLSFIVSASDAEADSLAYSVSGLPDGASFDAITGEFSWTPSEYQVGSYGLVFEVSDGDLTDSESVTINVNAVNNDPLVNNLPVITSFSPANDAVFEDGDVINIEVTASDADGDELSYLLKINGATVGTTSSYVWNTDGVKSGTYTIEAIVSDGNAQVTSQNVVTIIKILPPWDVNKDGVVNILDVTIVSQNLGNDKPHPSWDVNNDGVVNIQDLTIVAHYFGEIIPQ